MYNHQSLHPFNGGLKLRSISQSGESSSRFSADMSMSRRWICESPSTRLGDLCMGESSETMQKGHEASFGCFQGGSFSYGPPYLRSFSAQAVELQHSNIGKQAKVNFDSDGVANPPKLAVASECCGRQVLQENSYAWPALKEVQNQSFPLDGWVCPSYYGQYFRTHWFPQVPLQMIPQSYPPEYYFQEFQYFVVIDFEATCDKEKKPHPQEIIEFPSVLVNSRTGQLEDCFQIYVRPTHNQMLSEFCKDLTGIQQSQVDTGVLLGDALLMHDKWLEEKGIKNTNFAVVTWSNWDCRVMLESECRFKRIRKPPYFNRWINLKVPFKEMFGSAKCTLKEAVERSGLTWEGRAHCGLDDAKNTARLLAHLMARGFRFSITSNLRWESADHFTGAQPVQQKTSSPPDSGIPYPATAQKWKSPPFFAVIPFQPVQPANTMKEPTVYCYCGATSSGRFIHKPGTPLKSSYYFFGCGNWTPTGGALCTFTKFVAACELPKAG